MAAKKKLTKAEEYQKAYNDLRAMALNSDKDLSHIINILMIETERATPKKPRHYVNSHFRSADARSWAEDDVFSCQVCHQTISAGQGKCGNADCGQTIDWSKSPESYHHDWLRQQR